MKPFVRLATVAAVTGIVWPWNTPTQADIPYPLDYHYVYDNDYDTWEPIHDPENLGPPDWEVWKGVESACNLSVPNMGMPTPWHKHFYYMAVFVSPSAVPPEPPSVRLWYQGMQDPTFPNEWSRGPQDWTAAWYLPEQPSREELMLVPCPLDPVSNVSRVEVGSHCIPEPSSLILLTTGALGVGIGWWGRRPKAA